MRNRWHRLQKTHALGNSEGDAALDALLSASGIGSDGTVPGCRMTSMPLEVAPIPEGESVEDLGGRKTGSAHGRSMWSAEEDRLIEEGVRRFGCKWRQIATALPGRSDSSIRNRWMRLQKERTVVRGNPQQTGAGAATWDAVMAVTSAKAAASPVLAPLQPAQQPPVANVFGLKVANTAVVAAAAAVTALPAAWSPPEQPGATAAATEAAAVATVNLAQRLGSHMGSQPTVRAPAADAEETARTTAPPLRAPSAPRPNQATLWACLRT